MIWWFSYVHCSSWIFENIVYIFLIGIQIMKKVYSKKLEDIYSKRSILSIFLHYSVKIHQCVSTIHVYTPSYVYSICMSACVFMCLYYCTCTLITLYMYRYRYYVLYYGHMCRVPRKNWTWLTLQCKHLHTYCVTAATWKYVHVRALSLSKYPVS